MALRKSWPKKRWLWGGLVAAAIAAGAGYYFFLKPTGEYLDIATAYVAQQTCTCRHVAGREMQSCLGDYPADAVSRLKISDEPDRVRVSAPLGLFKAEADFDPRFGCRLVN